MKQHDISELAFARDRLAQIKIEQDDPKQTLKEKSTSELIKLAAAELERLIRTAGELERLIKEKDQRIDNLDAHVLALMQRLDALEKSLGILKFERNMPIL